MAGQEGRQTILTRLTPEALAEVAEILRWKRDLQPDPRDRRKTPLPVGADSIPVVNRAAQDAPQYGLAWLMDKESNGVQLKAKRPAYPGVSRLGIWTAPVVAGQPGRVWTEGVRRLRASDWATLAVGDRVGAQKDSWDAAADPLGPMTVIGKLASPLVATLITHERGSEVHIYEEDGDPYPSVCIGTFKTVLWCGWEDSVVCGSGPHGLVHISDAGIGVGNKFLPCPTHLAVIEDGTVSGAKTACHVYELDMSTVDATIQRLVDEWGDGFEVTTLFFEIGPNIPYEILGDDVIRLMTGSASTSRSESYSESQSDSSSSSESDSDSTSTSASDSPSLSQSDSVSTSFSASVSISLSDSFSVSESPSLSTSNSESASTSFSKSVSQSDSDSISTSQSPSQSESDSTSTSQSPSLSESNSASFSASESQSESDSTSTSQSPSLSESNSASFSASISWSVSFSNSVSSSASVSYSESVSFSNSNSVSYSESWSTSDSAAQPPSWYCTLVQYYVHADCKPGDENGPPVYEIRTTTEALPAGCRSPGGLFSLFITIISGPYAEYEGIQCPPCDSVESGNYSDTCANHGWIGDAASWFGHITYISMDAGGYPWKHNIKALPTGCVCNYLRAHVVGIGNGPYTGDAVLWIRSNATFGAYGPSSGYFVICSDTNKTYIYKHVAGVETLLASSTAITVSGNHALELRYTAAGHVQFWLDGVNKTALETADSDVPADKHGGISCYQALQWSAIQFGATP